jgi:glycosyltransferase involved in cell wall biosynthesis
MINIISKSIYKRKTTGPKKVVLNFIRSLEKAGIPYSLNQDTTTYKNIWIQDSEFLLKKLSAKDSDLNIIAGPNIFVNPEDIDFDINIQRVAYLTPSTQVEKNWRQRGYRPNNLKVWPAGIDTDTYKPDPAVTKTKVLLYFKKRSREDLDHVKELLISKNIDFEIITYGSYKQAEYEKTLKQAKYIVWVGCYESQGIALQEALSCNVPILVWDIKEPTTKYDTESTSAPYFTEQCGVKTKQKEELSTLIDTMKEGWEKFQPREYILENLSLEKSLEIFQNFLVKEESQKKKRTNHILIESAKDFVNGLHRKITYRISKKILKFWEGVTVSQFKKNTVNKKTLVIKNEKTNT